MPGPRREPTGAARMRALAASLPTNLADGFRAGLAIAPPATDRAPSVVLVGMGGSGISSELARGLVESETPLALSLVRSPYLPRGVGPDSRVVIVSYSGNTWETLKAYDTAGRAGAMRFAVTSGGALAERAEDDGVPVLRLPPGMPPRSAVGHILGGILGLLDPWFPESNEARVARVVDRVAAALPGLARARGSASRIASQIGARIPIVYAESGFAGLARRWKTQVEENAKRLAFFDEAPELMHNAIVGWDGTPRAEAGRFALVVLEWSEEPPGVRRGFEYLARLVERRGTPVVRVPLLPSDRLEALVGGIALGDHVSLCLADARRVDPYPVDAITGLKQALGEHRGSRPSGPPHHRTRRSRP
jgi:glucose/mannose-6-phosphate isomerase